MPSVCCPGNTAHEGQELGARGDGDCIGPDEQNWGQKRGQKRVERVDGLQISLEK